MKCISINNQIKRVSNTEALKLVNASKAKYISKSEWKKIRVPIVQETVQVKTQETQSNSDDSIESVIRDANKTFKSKKNIKQS